MPPVMCFGVLECSASLVAARRFGQPHGKMTTAWIGLLRHLACSKY